MSKVFFFFLEKLARFSLNFRREKGCVSRTPWAWILKSSRNYASSDLSSTTHNKVSLFFVIGYTDDFADDFYKYQTWPGWVKKDLLLRHKNNRQRYNLMFFLTGNGLNPIVARDWILTQSIGPNGQMIGETHPAYGVSKKHLDQMLTQIERGTFFQGKKQIMDMSEGKVKML